MTELSLFSGQTQISMVQRAKARNSYSAGKSSASFNYTFVHFEASPWRIWNALSIPQVMRVDPFLKKRCLCGCHSQCPPPSPSPTINNQCRRHSAQCMSEGTSVSGAWRAALFLIIFPQTAHSPRHRIVGRAAFTCQPHCNALTHPVSTSQSRLCAEECMFEHNPRYYSILATVVT